MPASISVLIPCYNASRWIGETLESVYSGQSGNHEVIVVDDGSTDDSAALIERNFSKAKLIRKPNQGVSKARNTATEAASGNFIQYLDADDLLMPGKIQVQCDALERSEADVAYGDWQKLVRSKDSFAGGEVVARQMNDEPELELFGDFWCPPAAFLFRRGIVDRIMAIGGWNERLPVIQDARFALDCALHGGKFVYTPGLMAMYRVHGWESLSRRSPVAFNRDVYQNAREVEAWWKERGGLTQARTQALVKCYGYVARSGFEGDPETFESASADLERLQPNYAPDRPLHMRLVSKMVGYRRAETVAAVYRKMK